VTLGALPGSVEECAASLGISSQYVLDIESRRTAQRLEDALMNEVREIHDLLAGERGTRLAALCRVPRLEEWSEKVAVAITGHHFRTNDRRPVAVVSAPSLRAVAVDALGRPYRTATVCRSGVDLVLIGGADPQLGIQAERSGQDTNSKPQASTCRHWDEVSPLESGGKIVAPISS
jgi:hypothetical protein